MTVDFMNQLFQVTFFFHEVDFVRVDDEQGGLGIVKEKIIEGPIDLFEILGIHEPLISPAAFFYALQEDVRAGLEEDDQVRFRHPRHDQMVNLLIQGQFVAAEIDLGEYSVAVEQVVDEDDRVEQIPLGEAEVLVVPVQQKKKLGLESAALPVLVKGGDEGVFFVFFQNHAGVKMATEELGQRGFPGADATFDGDESGFDGVCHPEFFQGMIFFGRYAAIIAARGFL
jgi:hypothetical protein